MLECIFSDKICKPSLIFLGDIRSIFPESGVSLRWQTLPTFVRLVRNKQHRLFDHSISDRGKKVL